jgi:hypothetical protein
MNWPTGPLYYPSSEGEDITPQEMESAIAFITEQQVKFEKNFARAQKR